MSRSHTPLNAALRYVAWDWPVLPLHAVRDGRCSCGDGECPSPGKHPRTRRGVHDASRRPEQVRRWWWRWPEANVAIVTGMLVVVDIDGNQGHETLTRLQAQHGHGLPATPWVQTARGRHLYFDARGAEVSNSAGRLGPGVDVRGARGYVVAPPSRHATGVTYRWHGLRDGIAALPLWLADALNAPPTAAPATATGGRIVAVDRYVQAALAGELERITATYPGSENRNHTLNRAAFRLGQLAGSRLCDPAEFEAPLLEAALSIGLGEREARRTIASGLTAGLRSPRRIPERA